MGGLEGYEALPNQREEVADHNAMAVLRHVGGLEVGGRSMATAAGVLRHVGGLEVRDLRRRSGHVVLRHVGGLEDAPKPGARLVFVELNRWRGGRA